MSWKDVKNRAFTTGQLLAVQGVLFMRTHGAVNEPSLMALQAFLAVREVVKYWMKVQVVAFPQDGIYGGKENDFWREKAVAMGGFARHGFWF